MGYIVTDEKSLKEAAKALGYSVIKKPEKLVRVKPCPKCGIRPERWESIHSGYLGASYICKDCGRKVSIVGSKAISKLTAKEENELRGKWNEG